MKLPSAKTIFKVLLFILLGILLYLVFFPISPRKIEGFYKRDDDCFHPETKIKLQNGKVVEMQNLELTDILENGSTIRALMKVRNTKNVKYYKFEKCGVDGGDIYVTGGHLVLGDAGKYILVENHPDAKLHDSINVPEWFSCLITDNHKIPIGSKLFWDWEHHKCT